MPSPSQIKAGEAYVAIGADDRGLKSALNTVHARLKAWGASLATVSVALSALRTAGQSAINATIESWRAAGDALDKMAGRTGISVEALSELAYAAEISGTHIEAVEVAIRALQRSLSDAAKGGRAAQDEFRAIGLDWQELIQLAPDKQLERVADGIAALGQQARVVGAELDILGRGGAGLGNLLAAGGRGIRQLREELRARGLVVGTAEAKQAAALTDALTRMRFALIGIRRAFATDLADQVSAFADRVAQVALRVRQWMVEHRGIAQVVAGSATGVGLAAIALTTMGYAAIGAAAGVRALILAARPMTLALAGIALAVTLFVDQMGGLNNAIGAISSVLSTLRQVGAVAFELIGRGVQYLARQGWDILLGTFETLVNSVWTIVEGVQEWIARNRDLVVNIIGWTTVTAMAAIAVKTLMAVLALLKVQQIASTALWLAHKVALLAFKAAALGVALVMAIVVKAKAAYTLATSLATIATAGFSASLATIPPAAAGAVVAIGLVVGVFVSLGVAIYSAVRAGNSLFQFLASGKIGAGPWAAVTETISGWGPLLSSIWRAFQVDADTALEVVSISAQIMMNDLKALWPPLWEYIQAGFRITWDIISTEFVAHMTESLKKLGGMVDELVARVHPGIGHIITMAQKGLEGLLLPNPQKMRDDLKERVREATDEANKDFAEGFQPAHEVNELLYLRLELLKEHMDRVLEKRKQEREEQEKQRQEAMRKLRGRIEQAQENIQKGLGGLPTRVDIAGTFAAMVASQLGARSLNELVAQGNQLQKQNNQAVNDILREVKQLNLQFQ